MTISAVVEPAAACNSVLVFTVGLDYMMEENFKPVAICKWVFGKDTASVMRHFLETCNILIQHVFCIEPFVLFVRVYQQLMTS